MDELQTRYSELDDVVYDLTCAVDKLRRLTELEFLCKELLQIIHDVSEAQSEVERNIDALERLEREYEDRAYRASAL